jgi:hypothetical protein
VLESGGKDSLLTAVLLEKAALTFTAWFLSSNSDYPKVLGDLPGDLVVATRQLDLAALNSARLAGGLNGHVPVTYITQSLALIQAILLGKNQILTSIGQEGIEPNAFLGDLAINHQWSKTKPAQRQLARYVKNYISPDFELSSPLEKMNELEIAKLFNQLAWRRFGQEFSSCNRANYRQNNVARQLKWCGDCPKCANTFLLFAPFRPASELKALFGGQDLFTKPSLTEIFKGLVGVDGVPKPFECVGERDELRAAYHQVKPSQGYGRLPFVVPVAKSAKSHPQP